MSRCDCKGCEAHRAVVTSTGDARPLDLKELSKQLDREWPHASPFSLADWQRACHALARAKGWYDEELSEPDLVAAACANLHGEVSELWEACRRGELHEPCDKPCSLTCAEEELADIVIRALDTAGALGIDIERAMRAKHRYNETRERRHGGKVR